MYLDKKGYAVYNTEHFFREFENSKKNSYKLDGSRKKLKVDMKLFKLIITTFFEIYFREVFYLNRPYYFFIGGKTIVCRNNERVNNKGVLIPKGISILWYLKPNTTRKITISFIRGKSVIIWNLIQEVKKNINLDTLASQREKYLQLCKNNLIYDE